MVTIYQLRNDKLHIEQVQKATRTTLKFGIARTHGFFGSEKWWQNIESGKLVVHHERGVIARLFGSGMGGSYPEFTMRADGGEESNWGRKANNKELWDYYAVGRQIEIDYVLQRHRFFSDLGWRKWHKCVVEIRIGNDA